MSDRKVRVRKDGSKIITGINAKGEKFRKVMSAPGKRTKVSKSTTNAQGVTTKKNAAGTKTTTSTNSAGTVNKAKVKKSGAGMYSSTKKDGSKQVARKNAKGNVSTKATNKRGRVTEITRTKNNGDKVTHGKGSVAVKAANIAKTGTSKLAKRMQSLKAKKIAARKAGDTEKAAELRKKSRATKQNIKKGIRARRSARRDELANL